MNLSPIISLLAIKESKERQQEEGTTIAIEKGIRFEIFHLFIYFSTFIDLFTYFIFHLLIFIFLVFI